MNTPTSIIFAPPPTPGISDEWAAIERVLAEHFYEPDLQAARLVFAAVAAHELNGQPVWTMTVAPPGSAKTSLLQPLQGLPNVHLIDKLTPNTLLSGQIDDPSRPRHREPSLLHRVGKSGVIVFPDGSTLLAMKGDDRTAVLADLRRIFDGHLRKEVGTSEKALEWSGRITVLIAATPDIDRHNSMFQSLGERFVMIRWHRPGGDGNGEQAALLAMKQDPVRVQQELKKAVHRVLTNLPTEPLSCSPYLQGQIAALAELVVRARTYVPRDSSFEKNLLYIPEAEAPTRLAQQLCQLAKGSARLSHRTAVEECDMVLVRRAGFDSIPSLRRRFLDACIQGQDLTLGLPRSTLHYLREDLKLVGLLDESYQLSTKAWGFLTRAGLRSQEVPPLTNEKRRP